MTKNSPVKTDVIQSFESEASPKDRDKADHASNLDYSHGFNWEGARMAKEIFTVTEKEKEKEEDNVSGIDPIWAWEPYERDEQGRIKLGPDGFPLVRDALLPASKVHDRDYVEQKEDRATVDRRWFEAASAIADATKEGNARRWLKVRTLLSYAAIRSLGWLPWYARKLKLRG